MCIYLLVAKMYVCLLNGGPGMQGTGAHDMDEPQWEIAAAAANLEYIELAYKMLRTFQRPYKNLFEEHIKNTYP